MPSTPPFPFKQAPDAVVPPLAAATIVQQPVMSISYPDGCGAVPAILQLDTMPVMSRDPESIPDVPGGGYSYAGMGLEYLAMGVSPVSAWSGLGAYFWHVWVDGVERATLGPIYDGTPGPIGISIPSTGIDWTLPHTFWLTATYEDRPAYNDWYIDPASVGIIAFGCGGTIFWDQAGYWNPWVIAHHNVGDVLGPVDRNGFYLPLTGPWGASVPQQHIRSDDAPPCYDAYACTLLDFDCGVTYPAISYAIETSHQVLPACSPAETYPVFDPTRPHKVAS